MSFLLKATAVEGPQYAPNRVHTVEIICPDRIPNTFICRTKEGQFISVHQHNLLLLWENPAQFYEENVKQVSKENEQIQRELSSSIMRGLDSKPCPLSDVGG